MQETNGKATSTSRTTQTSETPPAGCGGVERRGQNRALYGLLQVSGSILQSLKQEVYLGTINTGKGKRKILNSTKNGESLVVVNAASGTNRDFLSYADNKGLLGAIHPKSHRLAMLRVNDVKGVSVSLPV